MFESGVLKESKKTASKLENGKLRLEGFDPRTGKFTWKTKAYEAANDIDVAYASDDGGATQFPTTENKHTLLGTLSGDTRILASGERFLCTDRAEYSKPREAAGGTLRFDCGADGKKATGVGAGAIDAQSAEGSHLVLGFADSVAGHPAGKPEPVRPSGSASETFAV